MDREAWKATIAQRFQGLVQKKKLDQAIIDDDDDDDDDELHIKQIRWKQ